MGEGSRRGPIPPLPLNVLTGFLGAGKTTLLNRLLRDPALADTVVIVNEFGEVGLDHLLVEAVEDGLVLLSAGCLCCTVRGDLVRTLEDLLRRRDNGRITPFRRVLIETTGLADPGPVLGAVLAHPYLSLRFALGAVTTLVDAVTGPDTLDRHEEARRQVAVADRLILTKADLLEDRDGGLAALTERLRQLNPLVDPVVASHGEVPADLVVGGDLFTADGKLADVPAWLGQDGTAEADRHGGHAHAHAHHPHDVSRHNERIATFTLRSDRPIPRGALDMFLEILRATFGPKLLRYKGLIEVSEEPGRPVLIQGVQHILHVPALLPAWPSADRQSRLVLIVEDVPRDAVERMWGAFAGQPAPDRPDAAALADNPLAPATMRRAAAPSLSS